MDAQYCQECSDRQDPVKALPGQPEKPTVGRKRKYWNRVPFDQSRSKRCGFKKSDQPVEGRTKNVDRSFLFPGIHTRGNRKDPEHTIGNGKNADQVGINTIKNIDTIEVNIQEYISSGIIESYVLGLASAEERIEFEQMSKQYPELIEARKRFEEAIEKQARENASAPPSYLKEKIWSAIQESSNTKIITMEPTTTRRSGFGWVAAASIILFLAAGYFAFKFYNETKDLKKANQDLEARVNKSDSILNSIAAENDKITNNKDAIVVNLVPTEKAPPSSANVFWDSTSSNVYLVVKNMPKLPNNKQYQLWALIDNKPVSLGLFDTPQPNVMLRMSSTKKADAFAITIEERGNIGGPNLEQLQSMGKTKLQ